jgi:uncharacterized Zn finger protein
MSPARDDREDWRSFPRARPLPAPEHGIKIKQAGATWWGQRWIEALERMSLDYSARLARGRSYARAGRTHDLVVSPGAVTARVTGSRAEPYEVGLTLPIHSDAVWRSAIATMAKTSRFAAQLLAGEMPKEIDAAFAAHGASLFPEKPTDLVTECSCPDWANPCKHVAAAHYVLGEALDRDPFLLFELRGRTKRQVMDALRTARAGRPAGKAEPSEKRPSSKRELAGVPSVSFAKLREEDFDELRAPLPALHFDFDEPAYGALLRQLGVPPGWSRADTPADLLGPMSRRAAELARSLALAEAPAEPVLAVADGLHARRRSRTGVAKRSEGGAERGAAATGAESRPRPRHRSTPPEADGNGNT